MRRSEVLIFCINADKNTVAHAASITLTMLGLFLFTLLLPEFLYSFLNRDLHFCSLISSLDINYFQSLESPTLLCWNFIFFPFILKKFVAIVFFFIKALILFKLTVIATIEIVVDPWAFYVSFPCLNSWILHYFF